MASITRRVVDDPESGRIALLGNNGIYRTYVELNDLPDGTDRVELVWADIRDAKAVAGAGSV